MNYSSQYGQDEFLDKSVFKGMRGGLFFEMGADDGVTHSNTLFFEKERGWKGLCVEPRKDAFNKLIKNRSCLCENICVSDKAGKKAFLEVRGPAGQLSGLVDAYDDKHLERIGKESSDVKSLEVDCVSLNDLLKKHSISTVDYFSLDTEGGELGILKSIDYNKVVIKCISVENNYDDTAIRRFMSSKGYRLLTKIKIDEIYALKGSEFDRYQESWHIRSRRTYIRAKKTIKKLIRYDQN